MSQPIRVQLAEGGTGYVQEGDPAWTVCRALQKRGFTNIFLPRMTLLSGKPDDLFCASDYSQDIVRVAQTQDQMASLEQQEFPCVHHWVLETPNPEKDHIDGRCKFCNLSGTFPKQVEVDYRAIRTARMTPELGKLKRAVEADWRTRLSDAEFIAGVYSKAA